MTLWRRTILAALLGSAAVLGFGAEARASGVSLYPGTDAAGMGGAFRGVADDWSAAFWNPAGLVDVPGTQVSATGTFILPNLHVTPLPYNGYASTTVYQDRSSISFPGLSGFSRDGDGRLAYGVGVFAPFGLGTSWDLYNLPPGYNDAVQYPKIDTKSDLKVVDLHPTAAYRLTPQLSAGAGVSINYASLGLREPALRGNPLLSSPLAPYFGPLIGRAPFDLLPVDVNLTATGFGFGGNLGLLWKVSPRLRVGVSWRGYTDLDVSGDGTLTGYFPTSPSTVGTLADGFGETIADFFHMRTVADSAQARAYRAESTAVVGAVAQYFSGAVIPETYALSTKVPLPMNFGGGFGLQVTPKWLVAVDVDWTKQASFNSIVITLRADGRTPDVYGGRLVDTIRESWRNVTRISVGTRYALGKVRGMDATVMAGYYHDPTPVPDSTLTPLIPDGTARHVLDLGGSLKKGPFKLTAVYKYIYAPDRTVATYTFDTSNFEPTAAALYHLQGSPQNIAGAYSLRVHEWVTGLSYSF